MKLKRIKLSIEDVMNNLSGIEMRMAVNLSHLKLVNVYCVVYYEEKVYQVILMKTVLFQCPIRTSTPKERLLTFKKYRHRCTPGRRYSTYSARQSTEETELLGDREVSVG